MNFIAFKTSGWKFIAKLFYVLVLKKLCNSEKIPFMGKKKSFRTY